MRVAINQLACRSLGPLRKWLHCPPHRTRFDQLIPRHILDNTPRLHLPALQPRGDRADIPSAERGQIRPNSWRIRAKLAMKSEQAPSQRSVRPPPIRLKTVDDRWNPEALSRATVAGRFPTRHAIYASVKACSRLFGEGSTVFGAVARRLTRVRLPRSTRRCFRFFRNLGHVLGHRPPMCVSELLQSVGMGQHLAFLQSTNLSFAQARNTALQEVTG